MLVIVAAVATAVGALVTAPLEERWARRLAGRGRLECAVRVVEGDIEGLTRRWRPGTARLEPAAMHFRRGLFPGGRGVRPGSKPVSLHVDSVLGQRRPNVFEWLTVASGCVVLMVRSGDANFEVAVKDQQALWVRDQLGV